MCCENCACKKERMGVEFFFMVKGTMFNPEGRSINVELSGRFHLRFGKIPTEKDARRAARRAYPKLNEIQSITFKPITL